ncbi:virulence RhuM family protein [Sulfurimonas sp.]|uniref:virulence RhuM family protein n=1 Tax=Sulfurimonas sp. TaxID=2022749 RepID=UPI002AB20178|nr:virulence RhuM family protein [Sulfurimonas sp.]
MNKSNINLRIRNSTAEFLIYKSDNQDVKVDVLLHDENIWLTQEQMAQLFGKAKSTINEHIKNIFKDEELIESQVMQKFGNSEFQKKQTNYYNLDTIISVGYRVKSIQGIRFRQWATKRLQEYIIKGFTMDDERLKNPQQQFGKDYFKEQLERIKDIRSSERRFYQQITDIYSECSIDYDKNSQYTNNFFATVQNKLHWAIATQTASEIIYSRANHEKNNMGLSTWKNAPTGRIRKTDVIVAKNYLYEKELKSLNRIVTMYLDYAEDQAERNIPMTMKDWSQKLNAFLQFNERDILQNAGKVTAVIAKEFAISEFEKYKVIQDKSYKSDFDMLLQELDKDVR